MIWIRLHDRSLSNRNFLRVLGSLFQPRKLALTKRYKLCTIAQLTFLSFLAEEGILARPNAASEAARFTGSEANRLGDLGDP